MVSAGTRESGRSARKLYLTPKFLSPIPDPTECATDIVSHDGQRFSDEHRDDAAMSPHDGHPLLLPGGADSAVHFARQQFDLLGQLRGLLRELSIRQQQLLESAPLP